MRHSNLIQAGELGNM